MFKRDPKLYLDDITESIKLIAKYTKGMDLFRFAESIATQDAVMRRLLVIGEACKNLEKHFSKKYPKIPWRKISGMRNRMAHEYFSINEKIVWKTIQKDLPELKNQISKISG